MERESLIQKYLHDTLSEKEHEVLMDMIENDSSFRDQLEIESVYYAQRNHSLKEALRAEQKYPSASAAAKQTDQNNKTPNIKKLLLSTLFLVCSLALLYYLFSTQSEQPVNQKQFADNPIEVVFEAPHILMGESNTTADDWSTSMNHYRRNEFKEAAAILSKIESRTEEQELYLGLSHLYDQNIDLAQQHLFQVKKFPDSNYSDVANWFISLIYQKQGQDELALEYWKEIVATKAWQHQAAEALLKSN